MDPVPDKQLDCYRFLRNGAVAHFLSFPGPLAISAPNRWRGAAAAHYRGPEP
jgi:hypothetical protein